MIIGEVGYDAFDSMLGFGLCPLVCNLVIFKLSGNLPELLLDFRFFVTGPFVVLGDVCLDISRGV